MSKFSDALGRLFQPRNNFSWVVRERLGGMGFPPLHDGAFWASMRDQNVGLVVSLTSQSVPADVVEPYGIEVLHLPIVDFSTPSDDQIAAFVAAVHRANGQGKAVVAHCAAGIGRTGTMLSIELVAEGKSAEDAITIVRRARPGSIETYEQERAVRDYWHRRNPGTN